MAAMMLSECSTNNHCFLVKMEVSLIFAVFVFLAFISETGGGGGGGGGGGDLILTCTKHDITVSEGATDPLPNGIPAFYVEVINTCITGCAIEDIHLSCGEFASARAINPKIFKRLAPNDCLVNNGKALEAGNSISFTYANSFSYPLKVASFKCIQ